MKPLNHSRTIKLIKSLNSIFRKSSFAINKEELLSFDYLEDGLLEKLVEYLQMFPTAGPEQAWQFLISQLDIDVAVDTHLENHHPLLGLLMQNIVAASKIDSMFLIDNDEEVVEAKHTDIDPKASLDPEHAVVKALLFLFENAAHLDDNLQIALVGIHEELAGQGMTAGSKVVVTTIDEVKSAQADGGFSQAEAGAILDNKIGDAVAAQILGEQETGEGDAEPAQDPPAQDPPATEPAPATKKRGKQTNA